MSEDQTITIEINGRQLQANAGEMLIDAADAAGIDIPRFCYHKKLSVSANCRMCLVEVERAPKPLPACAHPGSGWNEGFYLISTGAGGTEGNHGVPSDQSSAGLPYL